MLMYAVCLICILFVGNITTRKKMRIHVGTDSFQMQESNLKLLLGSFFLACFVLVGLRDGGGVDDMQYKLFYDMGYGYAKTVLALTQREPTFLIVCSIGRTLGLNYKFLFATYSFVSMIFFCAALKNYGLNKVETTIYILGFFVIAYLGFYTAMRQALAMTIVFYYYSLDNPPTRKRITLAVFAFLVHYGSFVVVLTELFGSKIKYNIGRYKKIVIPIVCLIVGSIFDFQSIIKNLTVSTGLYEYMNQSENYLTTSNVGWFTYLLFVGYIFKVYRIHNTELKYMQMEFMQFIYFAAAFLTSHLRWGNRIQLFYILFIPFVLCDDLRLVKNKRKVSLLFCALLILAFGYLLLNSPDIMNATHSLTFK